MRRSQPRRTIRLQERRSRDCRLTPADVAFLLGEHRAHVDVAGTARRGFYRLTPRGHIGTIVAPGCRLVIRPKIPLQNLGVLLEPGRRLPADDDRVTAVPGFEVLDFLAGRLAQLLTERAAAGLHQGYAERSEQGPFLQGRLDLPAHLRAAPGRKDRLHCRHDEFTADVPCNQVPRATGELLARCPLLGEEVRTALLQALQAFAGVAAVPLGPELFRAAEPGRLTEDYRPLLDLCRLLADGLTAGEAAGAAPSPAFLLDMERVFERFCAWNLCRHCDQGYRVEVQPSLQVSDPPLPMRPDLLVWKNDEPALVLDSKWKTSRKADDVQQVLAYCQALGIRRAGLIYPGRGDSGREYRFPRSGTRLTLFKVNVTGPRDHCRRAGRRLAARVTRGF